MNFGSPVNIKNEESIGVFTKKTRDNFNLIWGIAENSYNELKKDVEGTVDLKSQIDKINKKISENEEIMLMLMS